MGKGLNIHVRMTHKTSHTHTTVRNMDYALWRFPSPLRFSAGCLSSAEATARPGTETSRCTKLHASTTLAHESTTLIPSTSQREHPQCQSRRASQPSATLGSAQRVPGHTSLIDHDGASAAYEASTMSGDVA